MAESLYGWAIVGASGSTEPRRCWVTWRTTCIYCVTITSAVNTLEVGVTGRSQHPSPEWWRISVEASHDVGWYLDLPGWQALSGTDDLPMRLGGWEKSSWEFSFPLKGDKKERERGELSIQWNKLPQRDGLWPEKCWCYLKVERLRVLFTICRKSGSKTVIEKFIFTRGI